MSKPTLLLLLVSALALLSGCSDISAECTTDWWVIVKRWVKEYNRNWRYTGMDISCLPISITTQEAWKMYPRSLKLEVYNISILPPSTP